MKKNKKLYGMKDFMKAEDGMGTVEIILIVVVLIGLVIIFKTQLNELVNTIFEKITSQANSI
ncbi:MAG: Flp1 family type IVb pilin [Eubacteriales bacterium]